MKNQRFIRLNGDDTKVYGPVDEGRDDVARFEVLELGNDLVDRGTVDSPDDPVQPLGQVPATTGDPHLCQPGPNLRCASLDRDSVRCLPYRVQDDLVTRERCVYLLS